MKVESGNFWIFFDKANDEVKDFFSDENHNVVESIIGQLEKFYDRNDVEKSKVAFNMSESNIRLPAKQNMIQ